MKTIVTVIGKDKPGIIAKVSVALAENNVNIEDISQTIMQGNFTMLMLCDLSNVLNQVGEQTGVSIHVQNEEIFNAMHKI